MIKAIIHYNDVDDEFRRMHDILGVLKYKGLAQITKKAPFLLNYI